MIQSAAVTFLLGGLGKGLLVHATTTTRVATTTAQTSMRTTTKPPITNTISRNITVKPTTTGTAIQSSTSISTTKLTTTTTRAPTTTLKTTTTTRVPTTNVTSTTTLGTITTTKAPTTTTTARPPTTTATTRPPTTSSPTTTTTTRAPTTSTSTSTTTTRAPTTTTTTTTRPPTTSPSTMTSTTSTRAPTTTTTTTTRPPTTSTSTTTSATTTRAPTTTTTTTTRTPTTSTSTTTQTTTIAPTVPSLLTPQQLSYSVNSECGVYMSKEVPLFVWVEGPLLYVRDEFVTFYRRVRTFLENNCARVRPTTLVIRTAHPYYVPRHDIVYWPPESSPLFTDLISVLDIGTPIKILLYPYVLDDFARSQWVKFAISDQVDSPLPRPSFDSTSPAAGLLQNINVYDGIFQYVRGWQRSVARLGSLISIDGFMIDHEEIRTYSESGYPLNFSPDEILPYKALYPTIKVATSLGYDDIKRINYHGPFVDYLHLQAYDLYYPYAGADATEDSIFTVYQDDPASLTDVLLTKVFTSSIIAAYQPYLNKIFMMWSTQTMQSRGCLYPVGNAWCGINNEFNWAPSTFNQFIQLITKNSTTMGALEHGIYTFNFLMPSWLPASVRSR